MTEDVTAAVLLERLDAYDPEADHSDPVQFPDLVKRFPYFGGPTEGLQVAWVSNFSELAYCPYKIWHHIRGTPVIRPPRVARAVTKGTRIHAARETVKLEELAKAKPATKKELQDPSVDLVELPECPARFRREDWVYLAKLDGLSRESGDLVVHELKTGRYAGMPDHLLQVSAYCLASPGAMVQVTEGELRAKSVSWVVEYPNAGRTWGPFSFRSAQLELLDEAMSLFERTGMASRGSDTLDLGWRPPPSKCSPCGFAHACPWEAA